MHFYGENSKKKRRKIMNANAARKEKLTHKKSSHRKKYLVKNVLINTLAMTKLSAVKTMGAN